LVAAAMLHNLAGYFLGYVGARRLGLSVVNSRTVSLEVGMQNGGMGIGLAMDVLRSSDAVLAPTIFGVFMTASGSALASWWRERPAKE
jgi:BASS family bile acid:Na+ symporter